MVCFRYIIVKTLHKGDNKDGGGGGGGGGGSGTKTSINQITAKYYTHNHEQLTITLYHDGILSGNLLRFNCGGKEGLARPDLLLPPEPLPPLLPPPV
jgi:hypothetical protein